MPPPPGRFTGVLSKVKWFWLYQSGLLNIFFATLAIVAMPMLQGFWKLRKCCNVNVARILMLSKMLQRSMLQGFLKFLATFERFEFQMLQKKNLWREGWGRFWINLASTMRTVNSNERGKFKNLLFGHNRAGGIKKSAIWQHSSNHRPFQTDTWSPVR